MELEPIELPTEEPTNEASALSSASSPPFDLEAYVARYEPTSETRLQRLLLIGSQSQSSSTACDTSQAAVAAQAYRLAERQCRDTANVRTYRQVFGGGQATSMAATAAAQAGAGAAGSGSGGTFWKMHFM